MTIRTRNTSRLILLDEAKRILLFQYEDHSIFNPNDPFFEPFWVMPGGGLLEGESFEAGAKRELWEETGIEGIELSRCLWMRDVALHCRGEQVLHHERFYLAFVKEQAIDLSRMEAAERKTLLAHRWWSLDGIINSDEIFIPRGLCALLKPILDGNLPVEPKQLTL